MRSPSEAAIQKAAPGKSVGPMEYRLLAGDEGYPQIPRTLSSSDGAIHFAGGARDSRGAANFAGEPSPEQRSSHAFAPEESMEAARQAGYATGEREGRRAAAAEAEAEFARSLARERQRLAKTVEEFASAREEYFSSVEQEVVKLALSIAARALHREAQLDPLLLQGVVRVALDKMADRSGVVLRAAEADAAAWEAAFSAMEPTERPRFIPDARLERGDCVLETAMGTVELGIHAQLEEIEKGFCDLLSRRPGAIDPRAALVSRKPELVAQRAQR